MTTRRTFLKGVLAATATIALGRFAPAEGSATLRSIIGDVAARAGLNARDVDTTGLDDVVRGYVARPGLGLPRWRFINGAPYGTMSDWDRLEEQLRMLETRARSQLRLDDIPPGV